MALPTLDQFIAQAVDKWPHNSYVREPGFASLYVRISRRYIEGKTRTMLDIANVTAKKPGSGAFTKLIKKLSRKHPELGIFVECVLNPRFGTMLENKLGFKKASADPCINESFYLLHGE
jgi:hypothetical protein